jgi:hypothetical protein
MFIEKEKIKEIEVLIYYGTNEAFELAKSAKEKLEKELEAKHKYNIRVLQSNPYILEYGLDLLNVLGNGGVVVFLTIPKSKMTDPFSIIYTLKDMNDAGKIIEDVKKYL